jgi:molybdenum cofactor biosynthesis protein MoaC
LLQEPTKSAIPTTNISYFIFHILIDITHKTTTLRQAIAEATVRVGEIDTILAVQENRVPKGDVLQSARIAGLFAAKRTSDMIPDCHPIPVEYAAINYEIDGLEIRIKVEIRCIYRTGVEVEAMHAASIVALTIYDMLKPIDKQIEIQNIRLLQKKGGKSEHKNHEHKNQSKLDKTLQCAVVVCSDSSASGQRQDASGKILSDKIEALARDGYNIKLTQYLITPDEVAQIQTVVLALCLQNIDLILLTGGTGLSRRDVTPEAVRPLLEREIKGIGETLRAYGQERIPTAMLSRAVAGLRGDTLIIALAGSTGAAKDGAAVLFPHILHIFELLHAQDTAH